MWYRRQFGSATSLTAMLVTATTGTALPWWRRSGLVSYVELGVTDRVNPVLSTSTVKHTIRMMMMTTTKKALAMTHTKNMPWTEQTNVRRTTTRIRCFYYEHHRRCRVTFLYLMDISIKIPFITSTVLLCHLF